MSRSKTILFLSIAAGLFTVNCNSGKDIQKEKKALFIILDGISADVMERVPTPHMDEVIAEGSYTRAYVGGEAGGYSESPTVSAVGYNHVLTGVWSNKHNVYDNDIDNPNYNYWSIFRLFKDNYPGKKVAIYSSWLDNRTKLAGDGLPEAGNLEIDIHRDGFELDTLSFPRTDDGRQVQDIDQHVSELAAESIREEGADLSWVYLWYTDTAGHNYGDGDEYYEALQVADRQIGLIWEAIKKREQEYNEDWLFIVTTDHGRSLPDGTGHGKHSDRERTIWFVTNEKETNLYSSESVPAVVDLYPTISRHLNLELPEQLEKELDGVPLIGDVSVSHPTAEYDAENSEVTIGWKAWHEDGNARIWISRTNKFKDGEADDYELVEEIPLTSEEAVIDVSEIPSDFYKIVIEGPHNLVNRWVLAENGR